MRDKHNNSNWIYWWPSEFSYWKWDVNNFQWAKDYEQMVKPNSILRYHFDTTKGHLNIYKQNITNNNHRKMKVQSS